MTTTRFLKRLVFSSMFFFLLPAHSVFAQILQAWAGPIYNTSSFKDFRHERAYEKGLQNPEVYKNLGFYANFYEGSVLGILFLDSPFMIGDYANFGVGAGHVTSQAHQYIDGSGKVFLGQGGAYGNQAIYSPGPISKTKISYIVDVKLGLQAQVRWSEDVYFGLRYFWRGQLNSILKHEQYSYKGVFGFYGRYDKFGVTLEHDFNKNNNKTLGGITSFTGKYYPWENKFLGFKIESATENIHHFENLYTPAKYTYLMLFFGFEFN